MTIDYRALLKLYMRHVGEEEGSVFLPRPGPRVGLASFTEAEAAELDRLDDENDAERRARRGEAPPRAFATWTERQPTPPTPIHPDEIVENVDPLAGLPEGKF